MTTATTAAPREHFQVAGLVGFAHLLSHLYMLVLPPFFPTLAREFGVGYVELGLTVTAFSITTGVLQTPMGFLVNKIGGRRVLIAGLTVNAVAIGLVGFATSYWHLLALMLLAGVGSAVFHPADYAILNARIAPGRLGRALAIHTLGGNLGFVVAPPLMLALSALFDWRVAIMLIGGIGVALAVLLSVLSGVLGEGGKSKRREADSWLKLVTSPRIMLLFTFYALSSAANCAIVYFSVAAFHGVYGLPAATTASALTAYQALSLLAVLPGGWLADRVENHELVLIVCFLASGALIVVAGVGIAPFWLATGLVGASGALRGLVNASRDVSVRHAAADVSVGTLFAFVTTGFAGGQILGPSLYGWLIDAGRPELVFWASAAFSTLAIATMFTSWAARPRLSAAE